MCIRISQKNQQPRQSSSFQGKLEMSSIYQGEKDQEIGLILLGLLELSPTEEAIDVSLLTPPDPNDDAIHSETRQE